MNKIDIIQRLLDERHITAKEALVLMEKEIQYIPQHWYVWDTTPIPCAPYSPGYVPQLPYTTCDSNEMIINPN